MLNNKKIIAIIPARGGSKGVPRKNLYSLRGQSLLARTIHSAQQSQYLDRIVVSSEDKEICEEAIKHGACVPFVRPQYLAQDDSLSIDVVLHVLTFLSDYDYVVVLQVTSPLRMTSDIDECIAFCMQKNASSCISVSPVHKHPFWTMTMNEENRLKKIFNGEHSSQRQKLPLVFAPNGAIYVASTSSLQSDKSFYTKETLGYVMPAERSLDIDSVWDIWYLEAIYDRIHCQ